MQGIDEPGGGPALSHVHSSRSMTMGSATWVAWRRRGSMARAAGRRPSSVCNRLAHLPPAPTATPLLQANAGTANATNGVSQHLARGDTWRGRIGRSATSANEALRAEPNTRAIQHSITTVPSAAVRSALASEEQPTANSPTTARHPTSGATGVCSVRLTQDIAVGHSRRHNHKRSGQRAHHLTATGATVPIQSH